MEQKIINFHSIFIEEFFERIIDISDLCYHLSTDTNWSSSASSEEGNDYKARYHEEKAKRLELERNVSRLEQDLLDYNKTKIKLVSTINTVSSPF
jgi:hypothetical protein